MGASQRLLFLPLPPRAPGVLPLPAAAPLLLPARLPPRATNDFDQASRLLVSRVRFTNDVLKAVKNVLANLPSPSKRYVRRPRFSGAGFPDLLALLERLVRRADAISLAVILAAALLLYVLRRWAAEGAAAADDDDDEANGITTSGRLPASTRRRLLMMALQLVPRGAGAGARRAPRAWVVRHAFDGHAAAAAPLQPEPGPEERLIFAGRKMTGQHQAA